VQERSNPQWTWIAVAAVLAIGFILSSLIFTNGIVKVKSSANSITVTGSAKQQIKSDLAVWTGMFTAQSPELTGAYAKLKNSQDKVKNYLIEKGFDEKDIIFASINTDIRYVLLATGQYSNQVESYRLSQNVEIRSGDVDQVAALSREATDLINQGVEFYSNPPQFFYTKIADLKVEMLSLATQDALKRAEQIASNANSKVGALRGARMGVFQITPLYSNEISDYGINDTTSLDKEITAVMNCEFEVNK
jgi:hypothetical protein